MIKKNLLLTPYLHTISRDDGLVGVGIRWTAGQHAVERQFSPGHTQKQFLSLLSGLLTGDRERSDKIDVYRRKSFRATFDMDFFFYLLTSDGSRIANFKFPG